MTAFECISEFTRSRPPCASPKSLDPGLQVHLSVRSISVCQCISNLTRSWPPGASLSSLGPGLQVHLQNRSILASKYIFKERQWVYSDTGVMEVDRVMGSIYSADPGADWHHLIPMYSYHTMKIHTLSFPTFVLTRSVQDFMDRHNCVDPQRQVVLYHVTRFVHSSNQNCSCWWIPFGCRQIAAECWWWALCLLAPSFQHNSSKWCISTFSQWVCPDTPPIILDYHLRPDWPYVYM